MKLLHTPCSRMRAFTLIELLSVVAVIGILAAILIPAIQGVRTRALEAKKLSNYRQYFVANSLYANEHKGLTVPAKDSRGEEMLWQELLSPYLQGDMFNNKGEIYSDPFFEAYDASKPWLTGAGINVKVKLPESSKANAFWNKEKLDQGADFHLSKITYPEKRIFIGDSHNWFLNANVIDATRHQDGTKGIFVRFDGSAEMLTVKEASLAITHPSKAPR